MNGTSNVPSPNAPARARVRVPCSTSNLGGGFDCVGVALDRWLAAEAWVGGAGAATLARAGTLAELDAEGVGADDDLIVRGARLACAAARRALPDGFSVAATSDVPVGRGLGSSAAALAAGALLADALLGLGFGMRRVAALCATEEGHPDNVAPMLLGGAVLGVPAAACEGGWAFAPLALHADVGFALAVPDFGSSTRAMRAALPAAVPHRAAVAAASKAAALVRGLAGGDGALLAHALDDVVHVPYRRALVPGYDAVAAAALGAGAWGATLSGAGSSLIALAPRGRTAAVADAMAGAWRAAGVAAAAWAAPVAGGAAVAAA
ncbi:homoserine kinase [Gemmatimonadetes bacterium T265]|nr:homoserine kinase [Gemmatimonadetes bacterium T265]